MAVEPFQLFAVGAVVMGLAQTLTRERIFAPLRERLGSKETWLGYLVSILLTVIAAFYRVVFWFVDETQGLVRRRARIVEEETATKRLVREHVENGVIPAEHLARGVGAPQAAPPRHEDVGGGEAH